MNVYIDDVKADVAIASDEPLDSVLQEARQRVGQQGRIVVGIVCDGIDIADSELVDTLQKPQSEFERIELHSADPAKLVQEALDQAEKLLDETAETAKDIVELLTCGNNAEAMPILSSCCQTWLLVHGGIANAIGALKIDPDSFMVDEKPMTEVLGDPIRVLSGIKESVTAKDFVLLSDILSYEFEEAIEGWRGIIDAVRKTAANTDCSHMALAIE